MAVLRERVRPDAAQTLAYFREQGVRVMVVSGDNPATVAAIARVVDLNGDGGAVRGLDARTLPRTVDGDGDLDRLSAALRSHSVLGRVMPEQKRAIVRALQRDGHTVAMTGDGVNDALALKEADLGIAMGDGAGATKAVARLVLLDGRFATLPGVVAQGRRVMANMERVSNLFLTKTTYAALLAVTVVVLGWPYPYLPRHLTLVGALTIGTPAFILALAPNRRRYLPGFLRRVLGFAVPAGFVAAVAVMSVYAPLHLAGHERQARSAATMVLLAVGLWVLGVLARPWSACRVLLVVAMAGAALGAFVTPAVRDFFALEVPSRSTGVLVLAVGAGACALVEVAHRISGARRDTVGTGPPAAPPVPVGARAADRSRAAAPLPPRRGSIARRRTQHRTVRRSPREHT
jgi:cation-transporting ATPase E